MQNYNFEKQHIKGKLHAIERINLLLDRNSFIEIGSNITNYCVKTDKKESDMPYDGVITGRGMINEQIVYVYSQDFTINGGSLGLNHGKKIGHVIELAIKSKCPIISINDSGGARIQEGVRSLAGYGKVFYYNTLASGYIPQISIIAGPCAGGAVYSPGITDFIFVIKEISKLFVTGPKVVKSVTGQEYSTEALGGALVHASMSGVAHFYNQNEHECFEEVRKLVTFLTRSERSNYYFKKIGEMIIPGKRDSIGDIVPKDSKKPYDVKEVILGLIDKNSFLEVHKEFAKNLVVGFGKLFGITIGLVANQPSFLGGALDCDASDKGARFIRFCDAHDIPLVTLVDVPGFMPGIQQEQNGIIRHGAKLLYAYAEATTIKLTVILRKAYGGAYIAMCSKHLEADFVYVWDGAEVAVMGAEGAVPILYKNEIKALDDKEKVAFISGKILEYKEKYMNVSDLLKEGYADELINPHDTRNRLYNDIISLLNKKVMTVVIKKHGCIPL